MITGGFKNMNADQIIKCILGTMLKLEKTVDSNLNDKLDRGGYQGTAQDLSDSIESIYQPDTVIRYTAPTRVGNTFTFPNGGYDVLLSKQFHTNTSELETTIAIATDGFKRIDLIYYKADDTIAKIEGTESATVAVRPEVPAGGIELCLINIFGATIGVPEVNGAYVQKSEQYPISVTGGGGGTFTVDSEKGYFEISNYSTHIVNIEDQQGYIYLGREISFRNTGTQDLTFQHNPVASEMNKKFFTFPGEENFILKPHELLTLKLGSNGRLAYVGVLPVDISGKEDKDNKSTSIFVDYLSNIKFPSVKAVYDFCMSTFKKKFLSFGDVSGIAHTFGVGSENTMFKFSNNNPITATIPTNATTPFEIGTVFETIAIGNGALTVTGAPGVTILSNLSNTSVKNEVRRYTKIDTDTWTIEGNIIDDSQIEVSANTNILAAWDKKTVLFTANCTITVPAALLPQFGFVFRTLAGVTVTWAITAPFTWETTPTTTPEKTTGSFMRRGNTNTILLDF